MSKVATKVGLAILGIAIVATVAFLMVTGISGRASEVVANVNGEPILMDELIDELLVREGETVLNRLVRERLVEQEAKKAERDVTSERVDAEIEAIRAQFDSDEAFAAALEQAGHTQETLRRDVTIELRLQAILGDQVEVTEDELRQAYEQNQDELGGAPFEEARDRLHTFIYQQKMNQAVAAWLDEKLAESDIETFPNVFAER